jgi:hypothetical protein
MEGGVAEDALGKLQNPCEHAECPRVPAPPNCVTMPNVRGLAASTIGLVLLVATSCGGSAKYAGLTRGEATRLAKTRIEAELDPTKRSYYEGSIWNVAAEHGKTESGAPVWLIGLWNGQSDNGDCALASRSDGTNQVQLVSCTTFPKYGR